MKHLFKPMLFTSLTTIAGFASLALTPIPPVQVFGVFIAIGVFLAWLWTIIFIPAFIMLIPEHKLADFGHASGDLESSTPMSRILHQVGVWTYSHSRKVIFGSFALVFIAAWGISLIQINDNPIKWFTSSHPIRVADTVLNEHFGGTYMAYLQFEQPSVEKPTEDYAQFLRQKLEDRKAQSIRNERLFSEKVFKQIVNTIETELAAMTSKDRLLPALISMAQTSLDKAPDDEYDTWDELLLFFDEERQRDEIFKQPEVLNYLDQLQQHLLLTAIVGKSNSLVDVVKTVHRELLLGKDEEFRIPDTANAVAQTLITYQNSHRPQDLWHFVTPDYRKAVLWLQLNSGDNQDMETVIKAVETFVTENPPPFKLEPHWFGLTYINTVWQDKMVSGMLEAFAGSFLIVLLMMVFLFRSLL